MAFHCTSPHLINDRTLPSSPQPCLIFSSLVLCFCMPSFKARIWQPASEKRKMVLVDGTMAASKIIHQCVILTATAFLPITMCDFMHKSDEKTNHQRPSIWIFHSTHISSVTAWLMGLTKGCCHNIFMTHTQKIAYSIQCNH